MPNTFNVFFLGNVADIDTIEGNDTSENADSILGTTFDAAGAGLYTQIQSFSPGTTGFSGGLRPVSYDMNNDTANDTFSIDGGVDQLFDGMAVYNATLTYKDGTTSTITAVVFQDASGNLYLAPEFEENADSAAMEAQAIQSLTLDSVERNSTALLADRLLVDFVCFATGTLIKTQNGEIAIEALTVGDMVLTMDHGYQPIRWIGSRKCAATEALAPILIRKGALGNDRDLRVSPQHRMLLRGWQAEFLFGEPEVLATAKSLINDHSIIRVEGGEVEYFHMLFDTHEIVWAEGVPSESFHPGEQGWKCLDQASRDEILSLFPELAEGNFAAYGPSARTSLKHKEGQVLTEYMSKATRTF